MEASKVEPAQPVVTSECSLDFHASMDQMSTCGNSNNDKTTTGAIEDFEKLYNLSPCYNSDMDTQLLSPSDSDCEGKLNKLSRREVAKFQCPDCSFVTSKLEVFSEHIATHKNNEKEHECHVCQQKFKYKQSVKKHMMKHEGITPYHCPICDYKTNSHSSLEVHQRAHSGEKPFVCDSCGMRFAQNSQLRVHMQYHSNANNPYKCELCDYQSPNYYKLTRHMKVHRERPYACELCSKKFMLPYQLRNHAATHMKSPDSPFVCHTCKESFTDKAVFKKHVRESHGLKPGPKPGGKPATVYSINSLDVISNPPVKPVVETSNNELQVKDAVNLVQNSMSVQSFITAINHGNKIVSRIVHISGAGSNTSQTQSQQSSLCSPKPSFSNFHNLVCTTDLSPSLSSAVGKLSVVSSGSGSEHEPEVKEEPLHHDSEAEELNFPDDVVVIKPEAAPSGAGFLSELPEWNFASKSESSITPTNSEHSTSAQVSPTMKLEPNETSAELIQNRMSGIFDKLLFRATAADADHEFATDSAPVYFCTQDERESCGALDLSLPVKSEPGLKSGVGLKTEDMIKMEDFSDQPLDFSDKNTDPEDLIGEPLAKISKLLPDEEAIIKTNNMSRPYKCGYCSKEFIQSSHIRVHLQYHVNAANPFRCTDCSYTSASKYKLNLHLKVHRERRFICTHCPSKFTLNCRLNQHVKVAHGEDLPFKCTLCNVTFSSTNLLSWHVSNKHENPTQMLNSISSSAQSLLVGLQ